MSHLVSKQQVLIDLLLKFCKDNKLDLPRDIVDLHHELSQIILGNQSVNVRISIVHNTKVGFVIDYTSGNHTITLFKSVDQIWYFCALLQKKHLKKKEASKDPKKQLKSNTLGSNSSLTVSSLSLSSAPIPNIDLKLIKFPEKQVLLTNDPHMMDKRRKQVDDFLKSLLANYPNENIITEFFTTDLYEQPPKPTTNSTSISPTNGPSASNSSFNSPSNSLPSKKMPSITLPRPESNPTLVRPEQNESTIIGKSGYLMKFSRGKWKPRFYILEQDGLYGHKDNHRHMLTFKNASICLLTDYLKDPVAQQIAATLLMEQVPNVLVIYYKQQAQYLKCHSSYDRDAWYKAISIVMNEYGKKPKFKWFWGSNKNSEANLDQSEQVVQPIFGVPLKQALHFNLLPCAVYRCIEYLDTKKAYMEEGIYRLSGSTTTMKAIKDAFNTQGDVDLLLQVYDPHAVAGVLKLWFRELPENILTNDLHKYFQKVNELEKNSKTVELRKLVNMLPVEYYTLLRALIAHLRIVTNHSDVNKMTISNIGIVFAPTLNISAGVFCHFIQHFEDIFMDTNIEDTESIENNSEFKAYDEDTGSYLDIPMHNFFKNGEDEQDPVESKRNSEFARNSLIYEDK
eukprot:NODE_354_length_10253_cov_0.271519.p1 type:complete len:624 gc:universal NODE_354_length_10253_cov_0.271519:5733-7604(+)